MDCAAKPEKHPRKLNKVGDRFSRRQEEGKGANGRGTGPSARREAKLQVSRAALRAKTPKFPGVPLGFSAQQFPSHHHRHSPALATTLQKTAFGKHNLKL